MFQRSDEDEQLQPHRGTRILVVGLLSLLVPPLGFAAWIMGNADLADMRADLIDRKGERLTKVGRTCGMIAALLLFVGVGAWGVYLLIDWIIVATGLR